MNRLHWKRIIRTVGPVAALVLGIAAVWAFVFWMPLFPRALGRRLTEGLLRTVLVVYAFVLLFSSAGAIALGWLLLRARRRRVRRPRLARGLLLCLSCLVGLAGIEGAAAAWLAWTHRLPRLPTHFPEESNQDVSIVVIGESSALGYPYNPWVSPGQIVAWQLQEALPNRRVVLDLRARLGVTLEEMHQELTRLRRKPDILIVYSGNNEFLARFEGTRDAGLSEAPLDPILRRLYQASLSSALCRMIYETTSKHRLGGPPPPLRRHEVIDPPLCTPSEYASVLADFERRLGAIVAYCERLGTVPVLVMPAANEAGFEPNRTVVPAGVSRTERAALTTDYRAAFAVEETDPSRSIAFYRALLDRQPRFAEAHYRLGRLLERAGDWEAAQFHQIQARDDDAFPIRFTQPFQDAYRVVASRTGCLLIDGPAVLRGVYPHGILNDYAFHDAHHPSLTSQVALANVIVAALHARGTLGLKPKASPPLTPAKVAANFQIGPEAWRTVCARASTFYRDAAYARFDPSERLAKMRRYDEAAQRIDDGIPPEQTGIPGVGLPEKSGQD